VFDIPLPKIEVTEYRVHHKVCHKCNTQSSPEFPDIVKHQTSYGPNIKSYITYLNVQNHIPYNRIALLLEDLYQCKISEGSIFNILNKAYETLANTEETIKAKIISSPQMHVDETGYYVENHRKWLFTYSTNNLTYYYFHEKRGSIAMDSANILSNFRGVATHDCWMPYDQFENCSHSYCNAHFLRELNGIKENTDFKFPDIIKNTLLEMKKLIDSEVPISEEYRTSLISRYCSEIQNGFNEEIEANPINNTKTGKQGRKKQSKAKNLLLRMSKIPEVLGFFINPKLIPFDNNLAERDIRMVKVKQKVSGVHRSNLGAQHFCRIRGYISTIAKNNLNIWQSLRSVFFGNPIMP
jgi:transposase